LYCSIRYSGTLQDSRFLSTSVDSRARRSFFLPVFRLFFLLSFSFAHLLEPSCQLFTVLFSHSSMSTSLEE
jgi:hypothetical protein